jgi:hypothetical protein
LNRFISNENADIFAPKLHTLSNIDEIKEAIFVQASTFMRFFIEDTSNQLKTNHIDTSLIKVLKDSLEYVLTIEPNSKGLEYALIDSRRTYRMHPFLNNYDDFRSFSDEILLDIEQLPDNFVPAILFQLNKSLEELINNVQEYRARGIINLIFIDGDYRLQTRTDNLSHVTAKLTLDQTSKTGTLHFNKYANLVDKRTAQRLAHSIVKLGFELPDKIRIGMNFVLETSNDDFF